MVENHHNLAQITKYGPNYSFGAQGSTNGANYSFGAQEGTNVTNHPILAHEGKRGGNGPFLTHEGSNGANSLNTMVPSGKYGKGLKRDLSPYPSSDGHGPKRILSRHDPCEGQNVRGE